MDSLKTKLIDALGTSDWAPLGPHAGRQALFLVEGIPLVDVGLAIARDRSDVVAHWLESGVMRRPTSAEADQWALQPDARFETLIVQPFVLFRPTTAT